MLTDSSVLIVPRPWCLESCRVDSGQDASALTLRKETARRVIQSRAQVALGLPLPAPRRSYHLMIKRLGAIRQQPARFTKKTRNIFLYMFFQSALVVGITLK